MIGKEILENEAISGSEVKEALEECGVNNELKYTQNITLNHLARFRRYSAEDCNKIIQELEDEFNLRRKVAVHIVDLIPRDIDDLRLIFAKEATQLDKKEMERVLEILEQYDVIE